MKTGSPIVVEACVASVAAAIAAESAGADRLELNSALELDGLTPSAGLLNRVIDAVEIPVIAMARPRSGNFRYTPSEWETLLADARWLIDHGVAGIAFGCLDADRKIDRGRCDELRLLAKSSELVFHKAFDDVAGWESGLEMLVESGIERVMTSGQQPTASRGGAVIGTMIRQANRRIEVLPAGKIGANNVVEIVQQTACDQIHGSFSNGPNGDISVEIRQVIGELAARPTPT